MAVANAICGNMICICPENFVASASNNKCIRRKCLFSRFVFGTFYEESNIRNLYWEGSYYRVHKHCSYEQSCVTYVTCVIYGLWNRPQILVCSDETKFGCVNDQRSSRPKPGRMEEIPKGGRGPPWAVAPLEREKWLKQDSLCFWQNIILSSLTCLFYIYAPAFDKTKYMVMSCDQHAGQSHSIRNDNSSFEWVEEFIFLRTTLLTYLLHGAESFLRS